MKLELIKNIIEEHILTAKSLIDSMLPSISSSCDMIVETIKSDNKVFLCGNGGSAGDAQHIAAEFTGRFFKERKGLPAIALTTDTSAITAIGNDYGYENIFSRQIEALARKGDLLIGISTSGNSENVIKALELAQKIGCKTIGFSGRDGGKMNGLCDINLVVNSDITARIQEMHILMGHIICSSIDDEY